MAQTRILVQGWRGISHSYAMVNQYQLLELRRRPSIALFHQDVPFYGAHWNAAQMSAGFAEADRVALEGIGAPDGPADIAYRIAYPYRAYAGPEARLFCQITCECRRLVDAAPFAAGPDGQTIDPRMRFITPSRWSKNGLENSGLGGHTIHVVPHGVDPAIFHPPTPRERDEIRRKLGIAPDQFVFLNLGAMSGNKGIDILLRAFVEVRRRHSEALLLLKDHRQLYGLTAGSWIEQARLESPQLMAGLVQGSVAVLPTNLDLEGMRLLYGACDAYISPYRAEAFNLPPLEAAACGLPVAVTQGGATDDYADASFALPIAAHPASDGEKEFLEPDLNATIEAMLTLIERRARAIDPQKAVRWIGENFTWKRAADELLAAFAAD